MPFLLGLSRAYRFAINLPPAIATTIAPSIPIQGEFGDVFLKVNDIWRFVGKASQISVEREVQEVYSQDIIDGGGYREFIPSRSPDISMNIFRDVDGMNLLYEAFESADECEIGFCGRGVMHSGRALIMQIDTILGFRNSDPLESEVRLRQVGAFSVSEMRTV